VELVRLISVPIGAALLLAVPLAFAGNRWLVRISNTAIAGQVGLGLAAALLLATLPGTTRRTSSGTPCPDLRSLQGDLLEVAAYASILVGGVALASVVLAAIRRVGSPARVLAGVAVWGVTYPVWAFTLLSALCGVL
jgi:hypothetical protein